jgi:dihydroorotate dehydrogenase (fumarate)
LTPAKSGILLRTVEILAVRTEELRLPLLWIALLYGRLSASLAATTGVHSAVEAIKYLMADADVVMSTAALLPAGPAIFRASRRRDDGLDGEERYESVDQYDRPASN